ncbi:cation:proton antiporter [Glaciimonas sp. Gout2]|uniref:cation:proton antiporter n=2 Tax=unclassified Glaciimonas TaxID=2644401 RepID=UPI002B232BE5|nr:MULTISPECIES: cation:proton antiporter [unclassified Glaciimonas]MEB0013164.1 cation:proton antiporter [Glaciimonas sp. Cout2]MEB0081953.1 cation:proton antiporter [Glaciimonas sp. Gout2]
MLLSMGLLASLLERLPVSPAMFYLPVGYILGPAVSGLINFVPTEHALLLTTVAKIALLLSLFTVGLKLRMPFRDSIWRLPMRLGVLAMLVTIPLVAVVGLFLCDLPLGAAILLGAILAPTDPVLASDVQIKDIGDRDRIRFSLTGEGGLNDGTAFPFVMLGLALLGVPSAASFANAYTVPHVLWSIVVGLGGGWILGWLVGRLVIGLRRRFRLALGMEEFLGIGLIALAYGATELIHGIGFLAVFAAGLAMRRIESTNSGQRSADREDGEALDEAPGKGGEELATHPVKASAYMTETVLGFNQQLENFAEFLMVILTGILLSHIGFSAVGVVLALLLFFVIRPLSVAIALTGAKVTTLQRRLMAWFGIKGIGSIYYLAFALQYKWIAPAGYQAAALVPHVSSIVLTVVAMSIVMHGISATPLMEMYQRRRRRQNQG